MSEIIQQVQKRMLISLAAIAKDMNLHEGDHILLEVQDDGVLLRPVGWHDKNQEYIWSQEWQERLKASDEALKNGQYKSFEDVEDLIKELGVDEDANINSN